MDFMVDEMKNWGGEQVEIVDMCQLMLPISSRDETDRKSVV